MPCYLALFTWHESLAVAVKHHSPWRQPHLIALLDPRSALEWRKGFCFQEVFVWKPSLLWWVDLSSTQLPFFKEVSEPLACQGFVPLCSVRQSLQRKLKVDSHLQQNEESFLPVDLWFFNLSAQAGVSGPSSLKLCIFLGPVPPSSISLFSA